MSLTNTLKCVSFLVTLVMLADVVIKLMQQKHAVTVKIVDKTMYFLRKFRDRLLYLQNPSLL